MAPAADPHPDPRPEATLTRLKSDQRQRPRGPLRACYGAPRCAHRPRPAAEPVSPRLPAPTAPGLAGQTVWELRAI
eukprot:7602793-Pyramimonas_sp.AAC.1